MADNTFMSGMELLAADIQSLSQTVRTASQNISATAQGIAAKTNAASGSMMGLSRSMTMPFSAPSQYGFTGSPMIAQMGMPAPLNTSRRDNMIQNLTQGTYMNEFNKPSNWFRDILALSGKEFVDVTSERAQRYARRSWSQRGATFGYDAVTYVLPFIPGVGLPLALGYEFLAKPLLTDSEKRKNEYWSFFERSGARNVDARLTSTGRGGFGSDADLLSLADYAQGAWKGTGYKKSQWDQLMQQSERYGYFKSYGRYDEDKMRRKIKDLADNAKYAMQTLNVAAEEAAQILGYMSTENFKTSGKTMINRINAAATHMGISGTQMFEMATQQSEIYKIAGYNTETSMYAVLRDTQNIVARTPLGMKPDVEGSMRTRQALEQGYDRYAYGAFFKNADGKLTLDKELYSSYMSGKISMNELYDIADRNSRGYNTTQQTLYATGGISLLSTGAMTPLERANLNARMTIDNVLNRTGGMFNIKDVYGSDENKKQATLAYLSSQTGLNIRDLEYMFITNPMNGQDYNVVRKTMGRAWNDRNQKSTYRPSHNVERMDMIREMLTDTDAKQLKSLSWGSRNILADSLTKINFDKLMKEDGSIRAPETFGIKAKNDEEMAAEILKLAIKNPDKASESLRWLRRNGYDDVVSKVSNMAHVSGYGMSDREYAERHIGSTIKGRLGVREMNASTTRYYTENTAGYDPFFFNTKVSGASATKYYTENTGTKAWESSWGDDAFRGDYFRYLALPDSNAKKNMRHNLIVDMQKQGMSESDASRIMIDLDKIERGDEASIKALKEGDQERIMKGIASGISAQTEAIQGLHQREGSMMDVMLAAEETITMLTTVIEKEKGKKK